MARSKLAEGYFMKHWYYHHENEKKGPVEETILIRLLKSGGLPSDALVWSEGMEDWIVAVKVEGLARASFGAPPPLPTHANGSSGTSQYRKISTQTLFSRIISDEVSLYSGLKRFFCIMSLIAGIFSLVIWNEVSWWMALITFVFCLLLARMPLWAAKDFRRVLSPDALNRDVRLSRLARTSWFLGVFASIIAFFWLCDSYRIEYIVYSLSWGVGVALILRCCVWIAVGNGFVDKQHEAPLGFLNGLLVTLIIFVVVFLFITLIFTFLSEISYDSSHRL